MKKTDIMKLVKPSVRKLRAYNAREIPCRVKLDANESPYAWDPATLAKVSRGMETNRYPDPEAKLLKKALGKRVGVAPESILPGNGSDELIYYLITTFGGPVLYPVPTFSMYGIISQALGEKGIAVPLEGEFDLSLEEMLRAMRKEKPKLVFLSSPNNPTGNCFSASRIMKIIESSKGIVVVDEAYQPFSSTKGFLPLLKDYPNLVIMRTLSKIGLAALRLGFLVAEPGLLAEVNKVRLPFNVNSFSQAMAAAVLRDEKRLSASVRAVASERGRLMREMQRIEGVTPFPSEANFILFRAGNAGQLYRALLDSGVLVRNLDEAIPGCLRVTVGAPRENTAFLKALKSALGR